MGLLQKDKSKKSLQKGGEEAENKLKEAEMNMNMFREVLDPQLNQTKTANKSLYDKSKPTDTALSKKHLGAITWDLTGSKLVTGAADGSIKIYNQEASGSMKKL